MFTGISRVQKSFTIVDHIAIEDSEPNGSLWIGMDCLQIPFAITNEKNIPSPDVHADVIRVGGEFRRPGSYFRFRK